MEKDDIKDTLKDVISSLIKDDPEAAKQGLHDVLAAKMRERITPPVTTEVDPEDDPTDPEDDPTT